MNDQKVVIPAFQVRQPIGEFYTGVISAHDLIQISFADMRAIERDIDNYLGIQRRLSKDRVKEIEAYVTTADATFPTAIVLAVEGRCATWDAGSNQLTLAPAAGTQYFEIAKILDGQHRIEGLKKLPEGIEFDLNVTVFVNADLADQANIFATVNLAQTKVNRSLVYDLYDYANTRSPQKTAHDVVVALDRFPKGAFFGRIKRLGVATEGRVKEPLTQAAIVASLLDLTTSNAMADRDLLRRGKKPKLADVAELKKRPFRNLFIEEKDTDIARIVSNYFGAVRDKWPNAWDALSEKGNILPRTNGFKAFMRVFLPTYIKLVDDRIGTVPDVSEFASILDPVTLKDSDFTSSKFPPGTSGETMLATRVLADLSGRTPNSGT